MSAIASLKERLGSALAETETGLVATPPDAAALTATMALAGEAGLSVLVAGAGLRLGWGNPVAADLVVATSALGRIVEHAPDDMVVTAEAGMTLADLNAHLETRFQVLPLEVPYPERTTLGGLVAAAPLSLSRPGYGEVKDWLIGLTVASPDGELVHGGGKVVKNVAGYDLCKLYASSLGTLGAIATVTFRVRPRWEATALVSATWAGSSAEAALAAMQTTHLAPAVNALVFEGDRMRGVLGFDGFAETVDWQVQEAVGLCMGLGAEPWALRDEAALAARAELTRSLHGSPPGFSVRASVLPSDVLAFFGEARRHAADLGFDLAGRALAPTGSLWLQGEAPADVRVRWLAEVRTLARSLGGHVALEGREGWPEEVDSFMLDRTTRLLMGRIRAGLDPHGRMAPGRFRLEGGTHGR